MRSHGGAWRANPIGKSSGRDRKAWLKIKNMKAPARATHITDYSYYAQQPSLNAFIIAKCAQPPVMPYTPE
jgi:hypothetical protein